MRHFSVLTVSYVPALLMNMINQASVFIKGENKYDLGLTINITIMVVLASIYLSEANSLPETANIKPVELWLLFNLIYNACIIITLVIMQVMLVYFWKSFFICLNAENWWLWRRFCYSNRGNKWQEENFLSLQKY